MNVFKRNPFRACAYTMLVVLLLTPFFAMQFSNEVNWSIFDFLIFACLLGSFAFACEKFVSLSQKASYRAGAITLAFSFILLIWVNLAVGIVGDEGQPENLLYYLIPIISSLLILKYKNTSRGMFLVSLSASVIHILITAVISFLSLGELEESLFFIITSNGVFVILYLLAAGFFFAGAQGWH